MDKLNPNLYEILGKIPENASQDEIKKAYRELAKQFHPDLNKDNEEFAESQMKLLNSAYETLSNPQKREEYRQSLYSYRQEKIEEERIKSDNKRKQSIQPVPLNNDVVKVAVGLAGVALFIVALGLLVEAFTDND